MADKQERPDNVMNFRPSTAANANIRAKYSLEPPSPTSITCGPDSYSPTPTPIELDVAVNGGSSGYPEQHLHRELPPPVPAAFRPPPQRPRYSSCPSGHSLQICAGRLDGDTETKCNSCRKIMSSNCILSYCCQDCSFDICRECVTNELVPPLQALLDHVKLVVSVFEANWIVQSTSELT
jgi:hypothetical protein